jgi:citrate lyase beta subunit
MRHFAFLDDARRAELFHRLPRYVPADGNRLQIATGLGATLYAPGTRRDLAADARRQAAAGVASMVFCLEDAIADDEVARAEQNVVAALRALSAVPPHRYPMVFVRVRDEPQLRRIVDALHSRSEGDRSAALAGFVLPKFSEEGGPGQLEAVEAASERLGRRVWAMPVLETPEIIYRESRVDALLAVRRLIDKHVDNVLAVRIGATDLCGLFGLRRDRDLTIYDLSVVRECIGDIVNVCGRDGSHVVTGPVWEYFSSPERLWVSPLRVTPFEQAHETPLRHELVSLDLDRLLREVVLDKANGLLGKTVIHPNHVAAVHALQVVTHEEYVDACTVLDGDAGGVRRSGYGNKMNELRPHRAWAETVQRRAAVFGVLAAGATFVDVLAAAYDLPTPAREPTPVLVPVPARAAW